MSTCDYVGNHPICIDITITCPVYWNVKMWSYVSPGTKVSEEKIFINFLPLGPKAGGVLSLPASVRLSVCLSVCPSVCLSVCLSVRPYDHACPRDNSKNIFQIFSKLAWNILWVNISDKFDDGYRSSLNMRIIDQKVTLTFFEFLK